MSTSREHRRVVRTAAPLPAVETDPASSALVVFVRAEAPPDLAERIAAVSPRARVVTARDLELRPGLLEQIEVLFTHFIDPRLVATAPRLRWVQTLGAGVEWLLTPEVVERSTLRITNASGIHAQPIAEHVFGFILMFARRLHHAGQKQALSHWDQAGLREGLHSLEGATLGVLGLGAIGQRVAQIGAAFGMRVIGSRRGGAPVEGVERVLPPEQLHELLAASDYVVNTLPLTPATRHLLGGDAFRAMRKGAFFVNIGRGGTVDTDALVSALRQGQIAGAGLDVTEPEPLPKEHPLWTLDNVIISPHYAGAHPGYAARVADIFVDNLGRYLRGEPLRNQVDKQAGY